MPRVYDAVDLTWTSRGDFVISHNGDISDTYSDPLRSIYQEIRTRVMSDLGDWRMYPELGASISDYVGEPNNKFTAESIKTRITNSILKYGLVDKRDVKVLYMPVDTDQIVFRISLKVMPTAINVASQDLVISFLYNYSENNVYSVS